MSTIIPENIRNTYLQRRAIDLKVCRESLVAKRYVVIIQIGHQIRGNAITFGFGELESIGLDLENGAQSQNYLDIQSAIFRFKLFLENNIPTA